MPPPLRCKMTRRLRYRQYQLDILEKSSDQAPKEMRNTHWPRQIRRVEKSKPSANRGTISQSHDVKGQIVEINSLPTSRDCLGSATRKNRKWLGNVQDRRTPLRSSESTMLAYTTNELVLTYRKDRVPEQVVGYGYWFKDISPIDYDTLVEQQRPPSIS